MSTRRGPKVEPHENPRVEIPIEKLMTEEEVIAQEEFINEEPEIGALFDESFPEKRNKRIDELNQTELRMFHKTGILPEI